MKKNKMIPVVNSISVFGLGKLGACMVGAYASKGFKVIGVDIDQNKISLLNEGIAPVSEPRLQFLYDKNRRKISGTLNTNNAVQTSDISFIIVPTPSKSSGNFSASMVGNASRQIGKALKLKKSYHLVVLTSTVTPLTTEKIIIPVIEKFSGKTCGKEFGFCYSPEFIAIGDVIKGLLHPDFFLIGEYDPLSGNILENFYRKIGGKNANIARMNIFNAELTKITVNTFITAKISFANTIARICEKTHGGNAYTVTAAAGKDSRIGSKTFSPGVSFGGPCFPRDNKAFAWFAKKMGINAYSAKATDKLNNEHTHFLYEIIKNSAREKITIAILGLSYKPRTGLMEESCALKLASWLLKDGYTINVYDPLADKKEIDKLLPNANIFHSWPACVANCGLVVYATDHDEFKNIKLCQIFAKMPANAVFIDLWGKWRDQKSNFAQRYKVPGIRFS